MMKNALLLIVLLCLVLGGCKHSSKGVSSFSVDENNTDSNFISQSEYHKLFYKNGEYHYYIYDKQGDIVDSGSDFRSPEIELIDNSLIKFTMQTGTGIITQWGYFYDINKNIKSQIFTCIYDQTNTKVAFLCDSNKIVIQDIFEPNSYYKEITNFKYPLSPTAEAITNVEFSGNNKLVITYLTGSDYNKVTEEIIIS